MKKKWVLETKELETDYAFVRGEWKEVYKNKKVIQTFDSKPNKYSYVVMV